MGLPPFPRKGLELDPQLIRAAYPAVRLALAEDPLFIDNAADFGVSLEALDEKMSVAPTDPAQILSWLEGADQFRYAALKVLAAALPHTPPMVIDHGVSVTDVLLLSQDVHIKGSLLLEDGAALIVLGTLRIDRSLLASPWDYTFVGAERIEMGGGISMGELIATDAIVFDEALYLGGNDHSCRAPRLKGKILVDFERGNVFGSVETETRITEWSFEAAARALSLNPDESDLPRAFFKKLAAADALASRA